MSLLKLTNHHSYYNKCAIAGADYIKYNWNKFYLILAEKRENISSFVDL